MSCSSPEGTRRRWASPELVRRTVLEAASAWPELAGCTFTPPSPTASPKIHLGTVQAAGELRLNTLANLREDAAALAAKAAEAVRSARAAECQECKRWGGPPRSGAACPSCGALCEIKALAEWIDPLAVQGSRWPNTLPVEPVLARADQTMARLTNTLTAAERMERAEVARAAADVARFESGLASVDRLRGEELPAGWEWTCFYRCAAAYTGDDLTYAQICVGGARHAKGEIPPAVWSAVEARARRLGLVDG